MDDQKTAGQPANPGNPAQHAEVTEAANHLDQVKRGAVPFNPALILSLFAPLGQAALQALVTELQAYLQNHHSNPPAAQ